MKRATLAISLLATGFALLACKASTPGKIEGSVMREIKQQMTIGGKDGTNPVASTPEAIQDGAEYFQHHCQVCHGLDGHNTGVPFAQTMDPPVPDLGSKEIQEYSDGQLKWVIENGISFSGMPGWKGILSDDEMWKMVLYMRNLPAKGTLPAPGVYRENDQEHLELRPGQPGAAPKPHSHAPGATPHKD